VGGIEQRHNVCAPAEGADRKATADDFAERGQVGRIPIIVLRPVVIQPERDDLVRYQQHAELAGDLAQAG